MKLHVGIKQDEDMKFYMALEQGGKVTKLHVAPPVLLRVSGKFHPKIGTDEKPYHLELFNQEKQEWIPLKASFRPSKSAAGE
jgi:hypothetical protein